MAITTQDGLIAARGAKRQGFTFARTSISNMAAGQLASLYRAAGGPPAQPAVPGAAVVPDKTLTFNFNNKTGSDTTYIDRFGGVGGASGVLMLYDRLFHIGGLNGTLTTAQTVNSQSVLTWPARGGLAKAEESEWFLEWYTDTGATAVTATVAVTYTDTTTGTISVALAATMRAGRLLPISPPQGKYIASVQSVTLSATTGTAGSFGATCGDRYADATLYLPAANIGAPSLEALMNQVGDNACLWMVVQCTGTSTGDVRGEFSLIQG